MQEYGSVGNTAQFLSCGGLFKAFPVEKMEVRSLNKSEVIE